MDGAEQRLVVRGPLEEQVQWAGVEAGTVSTKRLAERGRWLRHKGDLRTVQIHLHLQETGAREDLLVNLRLLREYVLSPTIRLPWAPPALVSCNLTGQAELVDLTNSIA